MGQWDERALRAKEAEVRFRSRTPPPDPRRAKEFSAKQEAWSRPLLGSIARWGTPSGPFLEVACGGRPRSLVLPPRLGLRGFAADISLNALRNARQRMGLIGIEEGPILLCADAEALPFADHALGYVVSYEFLHHLPDPGAFLREVRRVLGRGRYHFDGEPFAPRFRLHLYTRTRECSSPEERGRGPLVRFLRYYTSDPRCGAAEEGIVENMDLRLRDWAAYLEGLPGVKVEADALGGIWRSSLVHPRTPSSLLFDLLGGNLTGEWLCPGPEIPPTPSDLGALVVCPACHGPLDRGRDALACRRCPDAYPVEDGIPVLVPRDLRRRLYPDIQESFTGG